MQRWVTVIVGLAFAGLTFWVVARNFHPPEAVGHAAAPSDAGDADAWIYANADAGLSNADSGPLLSDDLQVLASRTDGGVGSAMPDGSPVPPLPLAVPRQIRFGVVLVSYAGAQPSPGGGPVSTRSKGDARILSDRLLTTARQDFHAAVQQGDVGSADDVGQVKLGILEPAPEYLLFTSPVNAVGGPIDTPRGYWIVKRLE
ncbi:MAG: hypothetical protein WBY94_09245 [Polyangiaceae bacterium]